MGAVLLLALSALFPAVSAAQVLPNTEFDLDLSGQTRIGPDQGGISLTDELSYVLFLSNRSGEPVPAGAAAITASVNRSGSRNASRITSTGLNGSGFAINGGGNCAVGNTARTIRCVTTTEIPPGGTLELEIYYTHAQVEQTQLVFLAQATIADGISFDPVPGNNAFGGGSYTFSGATTTTTEPTTTTTEPTTTTTEASTTTESTVEETTTTEASTTTESTVEDTSTTETTVAATTTVPATTAQTTATTVAPATVPQSSSAVTLQAMADDEESGVLGATGTAEDGPPDAEVAIEPLAPVAEDGGFPLLPLMAVALLALLVAGATVAYYRFSEEDPPLVDIRQFN